MQILKTVVTACTEHHIKPAKPANHYWMLPEKHWSRIHIDHAIDFMGHHWLVVMHAYFKYPCIQFYLYEDDYTIGTRRLLALWLPARNIFGQRHNLSSFEFKTWCHERGMVTGTPYHQVTYGAAERLVQTFKRSLEMSRKPPKEALQEFLIQYRRPPLPSRYSPCELLNNRKIRTKIDTLLPSQAHEAQEPQAREATKSQAKKLQRTVHNVHRHYRVATPSYGLYCGPRRTSESSWVPITVIKVRGSRNVNERVHLRGPLWRRQIEQLRPRYRVDKDNDPGMDLRDYLRPRS